MAGKTYRTFGEAVADPESAISRFVREGERLMKFNPTTEHEWAEYLAWQSQQPRDADWTTQAWRVAREGVA